MALPIYEPGELKFNHSQTDCQLLIVKKACWMLGMGYGPMNDFSGIWMKHFPQ